MTRVEVYDAMIDADGERSRLMYRGVSDRVFDSDRLWAKHQARVRRSPEYLEANARFTEASNRLREIDGDSRARGRDGRIVRI